VAAADVPKLVKVDDVDFGAVDAVFCCLPHATTQKIISSLPTHLKIVDLSADFRLSNVDTYAEWCVSRGARGQLRRGGCQASWLLRTSGSTPLHTHVGHPSTG
jgi:N-acetyl-gamma-glutamyl-phosphate reductase